MFNSVYRAYDWEVYLHFVLSKRCFQVIQNEIMMLYYDADDGDEEDYECQGNDDDDDDDDDGDADDYVGRGSHEYMQNGTLRQIPPFSSSFIKNDRYLEF